jgi:hypothetical protein
MSDSNHATAAEDCQAILELKPSRFFSFFGKILFFVSSFPARNVDPYQVDSSRQRRIVYASQELPLPHFASSRQPGDNRLDRAGSR